MKINNFYSYNLRERLDIVHKHAVFISTIKYYGFLISLYILDKNFVEIYYNVHSGKIEEVDLLDPKDDRLNSYVAEVGLSEILN